MKAWILTKKTPGFPEVGELGQNKLGTFLFAEEEDESENCSEA